jgi:hypothetical protein
LAGPANFDVLVWHGLDLDFSRCQLSLAWSISRVFFLILEAFAEMAVWRFEITRSTTLLHWIAG